VRLRRLREEASSSQLSVAGLSASPPDAIDPDVGVRGCDDNAEYCFGVHGQMTLYFATPTARRQSRHLQQAQAQQQQETVVAVLRKALRERMEAGTFDDAHPDIVRVTYVEPPGDDEDDDDDAAISRSSRGVNPHQVVWPIVAAMVLIVLAVVALFVWMRRRRNRAPADQDESDQETHEDEDEECNTVGVSEPEQAQTQMDKSRPPPYNLTPVTTASSSLEQRGALPSVEEVGDEDDESSEVDVNVPPPPSAASLVERWDKAPSDEFAATAAVVAAAASLPRYAPSPSDDFAVTPVPVTPLARYAPSPSDQQMPLARETLPPPATESDVWVPAIPPHHSHPYYLVHQHPHSHPPPTTTDVDDDSVALHSSTAETGLLRILDRHENVDVEHLHEHIAEDDSASLHPITMEETGLVRITERHHGDLDVEHLQQGQSVDDSVSVHSSTTETRLLRIVERHGNLEVEHLHERTR